MSAMAAVGRPVIRSSGRVLPAEWRSAPDARTGREVWQLTAHGRSDTVYFESQAFNADESHLVLRSWRSGHPELYKLRLSDGTLTQITLGAGDVGSSVTVDPSGQWVWWISHDAVWRAHLETLEIEQVYQKAPDRAGVLMPFPVCFSRDARRISLAIKHDGGADLLVLDTETRQGSDVLRWPTGFSHPLICPGDRDLITFVPDGAPCWNMDLPQAQRVRTWIADARTGQARPFITPQLYRTVTHESWTHDGERMFFFDKNWRVWTPVSICSVNREGTDWRVHFTSYEHQLGHGVCSPDGKHFLADCQKRHQSSLILIDLTTGRDEILCWPDASDDGGHPTSSHVHASWSRSGRHVVYTSDVTGLPQVYLLRDVVCPAQS